MTSLARYHDLIPSNFGELSALRWEEMRLPSPVDGGIDPPEGTNAVRSRDPIPRNLNLLSCRRPAVSKRTCCGLAFT